MHQRVVGIAVAVAVGGCGPSTVWHTVSPDHRTVVQVREFQGRTCVRHDDWGPWCFDGVAVRELVFSPGSRHIAYPVRVGKQWAVVKDGQMGSRWDGVGPPVFGPTGARLAFGAVDDGVWRVVVDGVAGEPFDSVYAASITFDPSGTRVAYAGRRGAWAYVVIDGKRGPGFADVGSVTFSPDGSHVAYVARSDDQATLVVDGKLLGSHDAIGDVVFADVGERLAAAVFDRGSWYVREGTARFGPYTSLRALAYRPGDTLLTFVAGVDGREAVVVGGVPDPAYDGVDAPVFSPNGARWGYTAHDSSHSAVVVDGTVLRTESYAGNLTFSPDGHRLAYIASRDDQAFVVDDVGRHVFDMVIEGTLVFSQDGRVWACLAGDPSRRKLFVNVEGTFYAPGFDWTALTQLAWVESRGANPYAPTVDALRQWVAAEVELVLERYDRERR